MNIGANDKIYKHRQIKSSPKARHRSIVPGYVQPINSHYLEPVPESANQTGFLLED